MYTQVHTHTHTHTHTYTQINVRACCKCAYRKCTYRDSGKLLTIFAVPPSSLYLHRAAPGCILVPMWEQCRCVQAPRVLHEHAGAAKSVWDLQAQHNKFPPVLLNHSLIVKQLQKHIRGIIWPHLACVHILASCSLLTSRINHRMPASGRFRTCFFP
jgi:hypothetical protein